MAVLIIINIIVYIILIITTLNLVLGLITIVVMGVFIYLVVVVRSYGLTVSGEPFDVCLLSFLHLFREN